MIIIENDHHFRLIFIHIHIRKNKRFLRLVVQKRTYLLFIVVVVFRDICFLFFIL